MDTTKRVADLKAKADAGTISENEFVEYARLAGSRADEPTAREMYRTSYAEKHRPQSSRRYVN